MERRASVLNCDCCGCETSVELGRADLGTCSQHTVVLQYITHMKQEERMRVNKVVDVRCISRQVYSTAGDYR